MWVVIDPIGTIPVFIACTQSLDAAGRHRTALRAILASAGILLFFVVAGQFLLEALDIPLPAFQIAGGIILFLFALTMIFGEGKVSAETHEVGAAADPSIYPLAVPSIASPGAMLAVVVLTDNSRFDLVEQGLTSAAVLCVLAITLLLMFAAQPLQRRLGDAGAQIISRVMGMVLASVAVNNVLEAIRVYFQLA